MVASRIDPTLKYSEIKTVNLNDTKMESDLYQVRFHSINVMIAVGTSRNTNKNITYFPIYLVKKDDTVIQVGVYEFLNTSLPKHIDQNGQLIMTCNIMPLLYSFATPDMLNSVRKVPDTITKPDIIPPTMTIKKTIVQIPPFYSDIFLSGAVSHRALPEESRSDAILMRQKYHPSEKDSWVNTFMRNKSYLVDESEGNDKCFFTAIKDAFSSIGYQTSADKLRHKLSINISKEIVMKYTQMYEALSQLEQKCKAYLQQLQQRNIELKQIIAKTIDRDTQIQIIREGENNLILFNKLKNEKRMVDRYLHEYRFMKGVKTLVDFQKKIRTCSFWAETWAIAEVERILNVKFVILIRDTYLQLDVNNVIQCGHSHKNLFDPNYYIILARNNADYQLVSYKDRRMMNYHELPFDIKQMITDKCIEYENTGFSKIPQFMRQTNDVPFMFGDGLYNEDTVFVINENSANHLPGHGNGEQIPPQLISEYSDLSADAKWRNKLANEWIQPFELDGHHWGSAEHYYQGSKFKQKNPVFYIQFAMDSGLDIAKNIEMAKSVGRKTGKYKGVQYREPDVVRDPGFNREHAMHTALMAKFTQHPELKDLLLNTKQAKIMIHRKGMPSTPATALMKVRKHLTSSR